MDDREIRDRNPVIVQDGLREGLVARQHQAPRVAAGVRHAQQFQIRHHVVIEGAELVERLHHVEDDVGLELVDGAPHHPEIVANPDRMNIVPELMERRDHVVLGLPRHGHQVVAAHVLRRDQVVVHEHQHAALLHSATRCRPLCR